MPETRVGVTAFTSRGVLCECVKEDAKLRVRVVSPGYNKYSPHLFFCFVLFCFVLFCFVLLLSSRFASFRLFRLYSFLKKSIYLFNLQFMERAIPFSNQRRRYQICSRKNRPSGITSPLDHLIIS